jgi:UDP-N-acetylglucosamine--N-acetylmuramyl-(pentapeptide) pyrophosphoryl-undecaprenol N-acetylglucosamine transferase
MRKDILVIGGGTGGHLFPAIAVLEEIQKRGVSGALITDHRCMKYLKNHQNLEVHLLRSPQPSKNILHKVYVLYLSLITLIRAFFLIRKLKPKLVIGFGGYVTYPMLLLARLTKIPILLHEQNCFLGKVNSLFVNHAEKLLLSFEETDNIPDGFDKNNIIISGNPVRKEILDQLSTQKEGVKNYFQILITGGSQGASFLSEAAPKIIHLLTKKFPKTKFKVTQQGRPEDIDQLKAIYEKHKIDAEISDFFFNMPKLLNEADLFIGRAGASTISEIIASQTLSVLVPYPYAAQKHQHFNARMIHNAKSGLYFDQDDMNEGYVANKIAEIMQNKEQMNEIKANLKALQKPSSHIIVDTALQIMKKIGEKT